jgi:hypothetical protein
MTTDRTHFNKTWLTEMPQGIGNIELFDMVEYNINDLKKNGVQSVNVTDNLKKIDLNQSAYYWYEVDKQILLGIELAKEKQGWIVRAVGKNPRIKGKPPYASNLYDAVLKDCNHSIRLLSDIDLSDEGYNIWKKLFSLGHKISVYDRQTPGQSFKTFDSLSDFDDYFQTDNTNFRRYQYVLSESGAILAETRSYFNTRRMRELSGVGLND